MSVLRGKEPLASRSTDLRRSLMRVAFLSHNARQHDAIGNQLAEKLRFFQERGAEVRVFVEDARHLHADVRAACIEVSKVVAEGPVWDFLCQADLVVAV